MNTLSLSWLSLTWWWPVAVALSAALATSAIAWLFFQQKRVMRGHSRARISLIFAALIALWWVFGFVLALWPLHGLDEFAQWAHAGSYVLVPLWIGGIAWAAALLATRLLRVAGR